MNPSRRFLIAALALVFLAGAFGVTAAQTGKASGKNVPKAVVENKAVLLGEVLEGQDLAYTFVIKNTGTGELQIMNVKPG
jgi:nitrous oxide reductase